MLGTRIAAKKPPTRARSRRPGTAAIGMSKTNGKSNGKVNAKAGGDGRRGRLRLADHAVLRQIADETVVFDIRRGRFHRLTAVEGLALVKALRAREPVALDTLDGCVKRLAEGELVAIEPVVA